MGTGSAGLQVCSEAAARAARKRALSLDFNWSRIVFWVELSFGSSAMAAMAAMALRNSQSAVRGEHARTRLSGQGTDESRKPSTSAASRRVSHSFYSVCLPLLVLARTWLSWFGPRFERPNNCNFSIGSGGVLLWGRHEQRVPARSPNKPKLEAAKQAGWSFEKQR